MNAPQQLHPEDGDLVRFLDHELHHGECKALMSHLSRCEVCAERMRTFSEFSSGLGDMLPHADPSPAEVEQARIRVAAALERTSVPVVQRRWTSSAALLRVAAAAVLVFGVTLGVQPVRAWVMEQIGFATGGVAAVPNQPADALSVSQPQTTVTFTPVDDVFTFAIDRPQTSGTVSLRIAEGASASIQIVGVVRDVVMLPDGVHIANDPGTTATYSVVLPPRMKRVVVTLAGETVASFDATGGELPWEREVPLSR